MTEASGLRMLVPKHALEGKQEIKNEPPLVQLNE